MGDFKFVAMHGFLYYDNAMPAWENFIMKNYFNLQYLNVWPAVSFGLDESNLHIEKYALLVSPAAPMQLTRDPIHLNGSNFFVKIITGMLELF